ncbi:MAG TPA: prepilin-type N-terminal cleavage/methylation domain-containing protein [Polyangiaceae bacterium]|jgi:prepilin-type N-terminal cleavage/methylation domain-containing protein
MTRPLPRSVRRARRAYTVIEVLMAMTVMAIGGAAVITMQKTSVTGNLDARRADVANAIARTWVERLQRESMMWTTPSRESPTGSNLAGAPVLGTIIAAPGIWFLPTQDMGQNGVNETMSPAFDILGRDLPQGSLNSADFCVHVRLQWLGTTLIAPFGDLMRVDVRVVWPVGIVNALPGFCNAANAALLDPNTDPSVLRVAGSDPNQPAFHAIYLTTTIRENAAP